MLRDKEVLIHGSLDMGTGDRDRIRKDGGIAPVARADSRGRGGSFRTNLKKEVDQEGSRKEHHLSRAGVSCAVERGVAQDSVPATMWQQKRTVIGVVGVVEWDTGQWHAHSRVWKKGTGLESSSRTNQEDGETRRPNRRGGSCL